jgi:hypothetical protein
MSTEKLFIVVVWDKNLARAIPAFEDYCGHRERRFIVNRKRRVATETPKKGLSEARKPALDQLNAREPANPSEGIALTCGYQPVCFQVADQSYRSWLWRHQPRRPLLSGTMAFYRELK